MNIASTDEPLEIVAKMCCCKDKEKKVIYSFVAGITISVAVTVIIAAA